MSAWRDNTERISQQENVSGLLVLDDENLPMMVSGVADASHIPAIKKIATEEGLAATIGTDMRVLLRKEDGYTYAIYTKEQP